MYAIYYSSDSNFYYTIYNNKVIYDKNIKNLFGSGYLYSAWIPSEIQDATFGFRYLFSVNSYEDALQNYPEYFI